MNTGTPTSAGARPDGPGFQLPAGAPGGAARAIVDHVCRAVLDRRETVELAVVAALAGGHILLEDLPGTGKTTLAKALSQTIGGDLRRVQATADLLPADITGSNIWDPSRAAFTFVPGPIFCNVLLVDELNRTPPRSQSAFLEAMDEGAVTVDGVRRPLPAPFSADRDPEPARAARHVPAAGRPARPVRADPSARPQQHRDGAQGSAQPAGRFPAGRAEAAAVPSPIRSAARRCRPGPRCRPAHRLHPDDHRGHPPLARGRDRSQHPRRPVPGPMRTSARPALRTRPRHPRRCPRARTRLTRSPAQHARQRRRRLIGARCAGGRGGSRLRTDAVLVARGICLP